MSEEGVSGEGVSGEEGDLKRAAALAALAHVRNGMRLGLGTGSTSAQFIRALGERLTDGDLTGVVGVATSEASAMLAVQVGIPLGDLDARPLDLAVDGMDELDPDLNAVKGLGGALTREKLVALSARRLILIGDEGKRVARLGERAPIPVEVVPFGWQATAARLRALGLVPALREVPGGPFVTDNHNYILDCRSEGRFDAGALGQAIKGTPGVLEHGLFLGMADLAYLASATGVQELRPA